MGSFLIYLFLVSIFFFKNKLYIFSKDEVILYKNINFVIIFKSEN